MLDNQRQSARKARQQRVRKKVRGSNTLPRVCVYRSLKHIYAQIISDDKGVTLASVSTLSPNIKSGKLKSAKSVDAAKQVGQALAQACREKNISRVVFDRNGFMFHGRVKALADALREGGIKF
ncbi:MAG: 50S ribosomal protein L18 [Deltaproteobacteria bacterium RIFCSPLOWO2_12_FULL_60_19]|nr:MAG: 50S ribosomal protein L18 [Deltaproteobacteria bacterium RIFCSPLOWO2_12_FULL_60_19]